MTEEIESEVLKEYPQLPVARQSEGEITVSKHVCNSFCINNFLSQIYIKTILISLLTF